MVFEGKCWYQETEIHVQFFHNLHFPKIPGILNMMVTWINPKKLAISRIFHLDFLEISAGEESETTAVMTHEAKWKESWGRHIHKPRRGSCTLHPSTDKSYLLKKILCWLQANESFYWWNTSTSHRVGSKCSKHNDAELTTLNWPFNFRKK